MISHLIIIRPSLGAVNSPPGPFWVTERTILVLVQVDYMVLVLTGYAGLSGLSPAPRRARPGCQEA